MRPPVVALALALLGLQGASALDKDAILKLADAPHSRENLVPELRVFADIRNYEWEFTMSPAEGEPREIETTRGTMKVVEGKYIVSQFSPPGTGGDFIAVVLFNEEQGAYEKWILVPDGTVGKMIGIGVEDSKAIAWFNTLENGTEILSLEQHSDDGTTWTERHVKDGKLLGIVKGSARAVEK